MRTLGRSGPVVPPIVFGTSALGNLYAARPDEVKLAVLREMFRDAEGPVLLDFEKIDTLDSTGLGELIGYLQRFEERNRRMAIVMPKDRVVALLKLTRLDTLIRIFPDDQAALEYLAG